MDDLFDEYPRLSYVGLLLVCCSLFVVETTYLNMISKGLKHKILEIKLNNKMFV